MGDNMKLEQNTTKMGLRTREDSWQWYTAKVGKVAVIHVHNRTLSGLWTWQIYTTQFYESKMEYRAKEFAYLDAQSRLVTMLGDAMKELGNG
jgi:hypothetical protein